MDEPKGGYLSAFGERVANNGYAVVPILPKRKFPGFDQWEKSRGDAADVRKWVKAGRGRWGIGLLTRVSPAIDIDCLNPAAALHMEKWVLKNLGDAPVRIGLAPKRLLLFRCDEPFRKITSKDWRDSEGRKNQVEIMGDGEQIVAFHTHPDTGKPYYWTTDETPLTEALDDLPTLTLEDARRAVAEMDRYAEEHGWKIASKVNKTNLPARVAEDDPFADVAEPVGLTIDELREKLDLVPNDLEGVDYDTWLQVMMACHHETDGSDEGLEAFNDWSARSVKHNDRETERKWASVAIDGKGRAPVTARFILKLAKESADEAAAEAMETLQAAIRAAGSLRALEDAAAKAKRVDLTPTAREALAGLVQQTYKRVMGVSLGVGRARDMVRYEESRRTPPDWLEPWVFVGSDETFYNRRNQARLSITAFNARYNRELLTRRDVLEGKSVPDNTAHNVALNVYQVPNVQDVVYMPGEEELFTLNGKPVVNCYSEAHIPDRPAKLTAADKAAIRRVEAHAAHLIEDPAERSLFLDWLAYIVQTRRRPNWAVLLQGTEGDGKSFWRRLMMSVLGADNVNTVAPQVVEGQFNGWAANSLLVVMEEIRIAGHNRYEVLNQIKPLITNETIAVHAKYRESIVVPNTAAYLLLTNHRDALPVASGDTRYFILSSRWQTKDALAKFREENPTYYDDLYDALTDHGGALRAWLLDRKIGDAFNPRGRAPESRGKTYMVELVKSEELTAIEAAIAESKRADISDALLNVTDLADVLEDDDVILPPPRLLAKILSDAGFTFLGRFRIGEGGERKRFWSKTPERFQKPDGTTDIEAVKWWIDPDA